jgi:SAM-dependent methyltransferase
MFTNEELAVISKVTIEHYDDSADSFWTGTADHDVSQNYAALLDHLEGVAPYRILDLGCGPGRDLKYFRSLGHEPVGLDGSRRFVDMARRYSDCEVLHQDFLDLALPTARFDGIFANASLFHVPRQELPRVLDKLRDSLKSDGVLFSSNPRGPNQEGWNGGRFGSYHDLAGWRHILTAASFVELAHYYRPPGRPRAEQPWLATVWRKVSP